MMTTQNRLQHSTEACYAVMEINKSIGNSQQQLRAELINFAIAKNLSQIINKIISSGIFLSFNGDKMKFRKKRFFITNKILQKRLKFDP